MARSLEEAVDVLRGSVIECRAENIRFRQDQVLALHTALRESADQICAAIADDAQCPVSEAELEFWLGMDCIRKSYENLNFEQGHKEEYSVKFGKDNVRRRVAVGLVSIKPQRHSRFYSVMSPLAAALEAGNCVILELDGKSKNLDTLLKGILDKTMDTDTFHVSSTSKSGSEFDLVVDQTSDSSDAQPKVLLSPSQTRSVAIVDRTADVKAAAKAITEARLSLKASSCYSPDLVLVNEWIINEFVAACTNVADANSAWSSSGKESSAVSSLKRKLSEAQSGSKAKLHHSSSKNLTVVVLGDGSSEFAKMKVEGPIIMVLSSTGLVDSVTTQRGSTPFLASYLFASPSACKFLAEQVSSHASFVNHIPSQLLIGPSSPIQYQHSLHPRYSAEMFSVPRPQFVTSPTGPLAGTNLKEIAVKPLPPTGQPVGKAIGFFEQGILIGLGTTAFIILPTAGYLSFLLIKQGWSLYSGRR